MEERKGMLRLLQVPPAILGNVGWVHRANCPKSKRREERLPTPFSVSFEVEICTSENRLFDCCQDRPECELGLSENGQRKCKGYLVKEKSYV